MMMMMMDCQDISILSLRMPNHLIIPNDFVSSFQTRITDVGIIAIECLAYLV